ncbi:MAG: OB-fold nucleic acid binding domain-containing protein, partial [Anaerolineales bacterium]|nr:OB-fold nucleic acid binding domain-containing protein [Anaerolineales bacterium]
YRGEFEIVPQRASDVQISASVAENIATPPPGATVSNSAPEPTNTPRPTREPTAAPVTRTIGSMTQADKDARVVVTGTIARASSFSQGMRFTLDDGTGKITVLIWKDVVDALAIRDDLKQGAQIRVTGKVDVYNDELEVIPARASDVELLAAAPAPSVELRAIGSLSSDDLDKVVSVRGTIAEISDFSKGKYVTLQDDSGKIQITVFNDVLQSVRDKLAIGAIATVRGKVNLFRGKMEIVAEEFVIE